MWILSDEHVNDPHIVYKTFSKIKIKKIFCLKTKYVSKKLHFFYLDSTFRFLTNDLQTYGRMDIRMDGWMDGWTEGRTD